MSNSPRPWGLWSARLLCCGGGGGSPGKNTRACWPILVAMPFWTTIFPAAPATNIPEYLVLQEPLQLKQLHHLHTCPHWGRSKSSRAASGATPRGQPMCRGGNKATIETQGAVWLRKKAQNLPASCTSCRLNPHAQQGRLCVYGLYKRTLRAPAKETR